MLPVFHRKKLTPQVGWRGCVLNVTMISELEHKMDSRHALFYYSLTATPTLRIPFPSLHKWWETWGTMWFCIVSKISIHGRIYIYSFIHLII